MLKPQPTSISTSRPVFRSLCMDLKSFRNTETWIQILHGLNELWPSSSDTHLRLTDSEPVTDTHYKHIHVLRETETHSRSGSQADTHGKCRHHLRGPRGGLAAALLCSPFLSSPKASSFARHSKYNLCLSISKGNKNIVFVPDISRSMQEAPGAQIPGKSIVTDSAALWYWCWYQRQKTTCTTFWVISYLHSFLGKFYYPVC